MAESAAFTTGPWTLFWDMHSGGGTKEGNYDKIYIQAPEDEAKIIFYNRFGHNPDRVSCTCCGNDYSITESPDFLQASGYHRNCDYDDDGRIVETLRSPAYGLEYVPIEAYVKTKTVLIITAAEISDHERRGSVPEQGYVWVG